MKIVPLKKNLGYLDAYINLRNQYCELLLTNPVTRAETLVWLKNYHVSVLLAITGELLEGVVILHVYRKGEISIFIKNSRLGTGTQLLQEIEKVAKIEKLKKIFAWVDAANKSSVNFFLKNKFMLTDQYDKEYRGIKRKGFVYIKSL